MPVENESKLGPSIRLFLLWDMVGVKKGAGCVSLHFGSLQITRLVVNIKLFKEIIFEAKTKTLFLENERNTGTVSHYVVQYVMQNRLPPSRPMRKRKHRDRNARLVWYPVTRFQSTGLYMYTHFPSRQTSNLTIWKRLQFFFSVRRSCCWAVYIIISFLSEGGRRCQHICWGVFHFIS